MTWNFWLRGMIFVTCHENRSIFLRIVLKFKSARWVDKNISKLLKVSGDEKHQYFYSSINIRQLCLKISTVIISKNGPLKVDSYTQWTRHENPSRWKCNLKNARHFIAPKKPFTSLLKCRKGTMGHAHQIKDQRSIIIFRLSFWYQMLSKVYFPKKCHTMYE